MTSRITLHTAPSAGFDEPFEMLLACHERVSRMLALLQRLGGHLADRGADSDASQAARDVMRYFDIAGPAHHEDEERHVFPALLSEPEPGQTALVEVVRGLQADHEAMERAWRLIRADLQAVCAAAGTGPIADLPNVSLRWQRFADLYAAHIRAEEEQVYPAVRARLDGLALQRMGQEMAARRGGPGPR